MLVLPLLLLPSFFKAVSFFFLCGVGMKPEGSGPLEVVSFLMPVLGIELRSSGRAVSALPESSLRSPFAHPDPCVLLPHDRLPQQLTNVLKI